ncbi:MAG: hypothetical protein AAF242_14790, partial [Bacteroidota bacterium]
MKQLAFYILGIISTLLLNILANFLYDYLKHRQKSILQWFQTRDCYFLPRIILLSSMLAIPTAKLIRLYLVETDIKWIQIDRQLSHKAYTSLPLEEISPYLIDALISSGDIRFFAHSGIDP